jgi:TonB family protein
MAASAPNLGSQTLLWALGASLAVHAAVVVATLSHGQRGQTALAPQELLAELRPAQSSAAEPVPAPSSPATVLTVPSAGPAPPRVAPRPAPEPAPPQPVAKKARSRGTAALDVLAEPLADKTRLGEYYDRQLTEFPVEIDRPPRVPEKIVARYPRAALEDGREDSVAVWVIVGPDGAAEQIQVLDGTPEFADEVVAAVQSARFLPAENNLRPIRFPIALQFDFRTATGETTAVASPKP